MEKWQPIVGYEGRYEISSLGRVKSLFRDKIMYLHKHPLGYMQVRLHKKDGGRTKYVHCLVAEAFIGPRPARLEINHKNLNKADNRVGNLEYATSSRNKRHAIKKGVQFGRNMQGEQNANAKLVEDDVLVIRQRHANGETQVQLAKCFGVTRAMIGHIVNRRNWAHI